MFEPVLEKEEVKEESGADDDDEEEEPLPEGPVELVVVDQMAPWASREKGKGRGKGEGTGGGRVLRAPDGSLSSASYRCLFPVNRILFVEKIFEYKLMQIVIGLRLPA